MKKSWTLSSAATLLASAFVLSAVSTVAFAEEASIQITPIQGVAPSMGAIIDEPIFVAPELAVDVSKLQPKVDLGDALLTPNIPEVTTTIPETSTTIPETTTTIPKTTTTVPKTTTTVPKTTTTVPNKPVVKAEKVTRKYLPFTGGNSALYMGVGLLTVFAGLAVLWTRARAKV